MKCPNCFVDIKYRERRNNQCLKCLGTFVFEPKAHPLGLTDGYFSRTVDKLSNKGELFFTLKQLEFALNKKRIRNSNFTAPLIVLAFISTLITFIAGGSFGFYVLLFWIAVLTYRFLFNKRTVSLKQTDSEFDETVLQPWKKIHKKLPSKLIENTYPNISFTDKSRGFLLCDSQETSAFLFANKLNEKLNLFITGDIQNPAIANRRDLPIFILHDASRKGYEFVETIYRLYKTDRKIFDTGLRPQDAIDFQLAVFRQKENQISNFQGLLKDEIKWLDKGFYTPLFVIKPPHLIELVTDRIERNLTTNENI